MGDMFDQSTQALGDLDAGRAAYAVAVMIVGAASFLFVLQKSGFRAMVAVGK